MQAFGYIRGNFIGQDGPSPAEQKAEIEEYCKEKGFELFSVLEDIAEEQQALLTTRHRGSMLLVVPEGSHIIFATYGVMCRSHRDWKLQMASFLARKHTIHILEWGVSTDAPAWPAVQRIVDSIWDHWHGYQTYRLRQGNEVHNLHLNRLGVKGFWPRGKKPPPGFRIRTSEKRDSKGKRYFLLQKDHVQREQMQKIAEMIDDRGMTGEDVAVLLNRANIVNVRTGKPWFARTVWGTYRDFKGLAKREKELARYLRAD